MSEAAVLLEMVGHVAVVTLNRPQVRNAVDGELASLLDETTARLEADASVRAVVLAASGEAAFCAGADLKAVAAGQGAGLWTERGGFAGFTSFARTKPWIAAVDGAALGGGFEITLACDLIVASDNATFGLPEVTRGLVAAAGGLVRLPQLLPRNVALGLILTGESADAQTLKAHGLVHTVCGKGEALGAAIALAGKIALNAPVAVRESLVLARAAATLDSAQGYAASLAARDRIRATRDFQEGARAFVEKRRPDWCGA